QHTSEVVETGGGLWPHPKTDDVESVKIKTGEHQTEEGPTATFSAAVSVLDQTFNFTAEQLSSAPPTTTLSNLKGGRGTTTAEQKFSQNHTGITASNQNVEISTGLVLPKSGEELLCFNVILVSNSIYAGVLNTESLWKISRKVSELFQRFPILFHTDIFLEKLYHCLAYFPGRGTSVPISPYIVDSLLIANPQYGLKMNAIVGAVNSSREIDYCVFEDNYVGGSSSSLVNREDRQSKEDIKLGTERPSDNITSTTGEERTSSPQRTTGSAKLGTNLDKTVTFQKTSSTLSNPAGGGATGGVEDKLQHAARTVSEDTSIPHSLNLIP
ncbi:unnamed protein product, partial [Amoebophrya sp. A120]